MIKLLLIFILISLNSQNSNCKECLNCLSTCIPSNPSCLKLIQNYTCVNYDGKCNCSIFKDRFDQLVDCNYKPISMNLTVTYPKPIELYCRRRNMDIIVESAYYSKSEVLIHDVTSEIRRLCSLKRFCGYPFHLRRKCNATNTCVDKFVIHYFCKETKSERNNCDKFCFNGGKCQQCHTDFDDPTISQCELCHCLHEPQILMNNETINKFCNMTIGHNAQLANTAVIAAAVFFIILSGLVIALIFIGILYFIRRRKYKNYSNEPLLSYPLETELI